MNKKLILSIAAAAALLVSTPGMNKAEAASPVEVQSKVYVHHAGQKLDQQQVNELVQKYMTNLKGNQYSNQTIQQLVNNLQKQLNEQGAQAEKQPAQKPVQQKPAQAEKPQATTPVSSAVSAFEQQVVELTNQERAKNGLPALKLDVELSKVARDKSKDMQTKNYFSHTSPTYGSPFDMMKTYGISYKSAGENIAMGQRSPEEVVQAWMNSQGHRENIMNPNFTHIGVGHVATGNYWTQMFIGK